MPTACLSHHLHHITAIIIIVIVIVHFLFKRNFYFSSSKCAVEECDILLLLTQPLPCCAIHVCFIFLIMQFHPLPSIFWLGTQISEPNIFTPNQLWAAGGRGG
jgi:hypothetical protein